MMEGFGIHTFRFVNAKGQVDVREVSLAPDARHCTRCCGTRPSRSAARIPTSIAATCGKPSTRRLSRMGFRVADLRQDEAEQIRFRPPRCDQAHPRRTGPAEVDRPDDARTAIPTTSSPRPSRSPSSRPPRSRHRLHQRSAAAGPAVLVPRYATDPAWRAELSPAPHQPAEMSDRETSSATASCQTERPIGRVAYEPNSLATDGGPAGVSEPWLQDDPGRLDRRQSEGPLCDVRRSLQPGTAVLAVDDGVRAAAHRERACFELSKVETVAVRRRMLGHLDIVAEELGHGVAHAIGMEGQAEAITPARAPIALTPSPALSLQKKALNTLEGRSVGLLMSDGTDPAFVDEVRRSIADAGARLETVAPRIGGIEDEWIHRCAGSRPFGNPVDLFRRRPRGAHRRSRGRTVGSGGRGRLGARRIPSFEGDRIPRGRRGAARPSRCVARRGSRRARERGRRPLPGGRKIGARLGAGDAGLVTPVNRRARKDRRGRPDVFPSAVYLSLLSRDGP